jgi:hypothetical protein
LDPECSSFYQHLIGVMRWMVDLGRIDIATEVSMSSSYLACPREGHLENALHVMHSGQNGAIFSAIGPKLRSKSRHTRNSC